MEGGRTDFVFSSVMRAVQSEPSRLGGSLEGGGIVEGTRGEVEGQEGDTASSRFGSVRTRVWTGIVVEYSAGGTTMGS